MVKKERINDALEELYRELGRERIRYQLSLLEIKRVGEQEQSTGIYMKKSNNIAEKLVELEEGILKIVLATKMKGDSLLMEVIR